ncbi:MAG: HDOD domain-containing protein, partial [Candidatus Hydrogenedentota bacterium]
AEGGRIVEILIRLGHLATSDFARFVSRHKDVPSLELGNYRVDAELIQLIPKEFAQQHEVFPVDRLGKLLTVGMVCPVDSDTLEELERLTELRVKPVLCSAEDVRRAIETYYPSGAKPKSAGDFEAAQLESSMKLQAVGRLLRGLDSLPTLPTTVQRIQEAAANNSVSARDLARIIETDPPIAAKLLQLANSSAFGFPQAIRTIQMAVTMLGLKETCLTVVSSAVIDVLQSSGPFDYTRFWNDALFCATAAKRISDSCGESKRAGVAAAGLLHDIGRFSLHQIAPRRYQAIGTKFTGNALVAEEERVLGVAHPEAGYLLAERWSLPPDICEAIRFHHTPALAAYAPEITQIVAAAAVLTEARPAGTVADGNFPGDVIAAFEILAIREDEIVKIYALSAVGAGSNQSEAVAP